MDQEKYVKAGGRTQRLEQMIQETKVATESKDIQKLRELRQEFAEMRMFAWLSSRSEPLEYEAIGRLLAAAKDIENEDEQKSK